MSRKYQLRPELKMEIMENIDFQVNFWLKTICISKFTGNELHKTLLVQNRIESI